MKEITCLVYVDNENNFQEVYWCHKFIGSIEKSDDGWEWIFTHPFNNIIYSGSNRFIIDAKKSFENKFFSVSDEIGIKNENQMDYLKNLHLFPEIKND